MILQPDSASSLPQPDRSADVNQACDVGCHLPDGHRFRQSTMHWKIHTDAALPQQCWSGKVTGSAVKTEAAKGSVSH